MVFKRIGQADYRLFAELMTEYYREGEDADTDQAVLDDFIRDLFTMVLEERICGNLVCVNDEAVGLVLWMIDSADGIFSEIPGYGTILEIGIRPCFRGCGYGRGIVEYIEGQMRSRGAEHFYVCVYGPAEGFWRACGYSMTDMTAANGLPVYVK